VVPADPEKNRTVRNFLATGAGRRVSGCTRRSSVAKPPQSPPHSDIDGVHRDEKPNTETALETGETGANLKLARDEAKGKPRYSDDKGAAGRHG
jgi:hypothetical protein